MAFGCGLSSLFHKGIGQPLAHYRRTIPGDTTAPVLTFPNAVKNGSNAMTGAVTTNEAAGTLFWYISQSATPPSAAAMVSGSGADASGSNLVSVAGIQEIASSGLVASTTYYAHYLHRDYAGNLSAIVSSASFLTDAGSVLGAPTLSALNVNVSPVAWDMLVSNLIPYNAADGTGDQVRAIWTFAGGAATTEAWQPLDNEVITGTIAWPLLDSTDMTAGGAFTVYVERAQDLGLPSQRLSAASNTLNGTIPAGSVPETPAEWVAANGVNKSQYVTVSGTPPLVAQGSGGFNGAPISVRATQKRVGKRQFQLTVSTNTTSSVHIGVDDGTDNFNDTNWSRPGRNNTGGVTLKYRGGSTGWEIGFGGVVAQSGVSDGKPILANGVVLTCVFDSGSGTVSFYVTSGGATTQVGTTVTGVTLSNWYANCGFENTDTLTALFGAGQARALDTGYVNYDN